MDLDERIRIAKELLGDGIHVIGAKERKRRKMAGRFRKLSKFWSVRPEMNKTQYYSCASKHKYKSQSEARKYANRLEQVRGKKLRVYQCEYCGHFHLTSKPYSNPPVGGAVCRR